MLVVWLSLTSILTLTLGLVAMILISALSLISSQSLYLAEQTHLLDFFDLKLYRWLSLLKLVWGQSL